MAGRRSLTGMDHLPPPMTPDRLRAIAFGPKPEGVTHACPDCPFGAPRAFCPTCLGIGTVDNAQLDAWQARVNDQEKSAAARGEAWPDGRPI